jgi:hypothetical protein
MSSTLWSSPPACCLSPLLYSLLHIFSACQMIHSETALCILVPLVPDQAICNTRNVEGLWRALSTRVEHSSLAPHALLLYIYLSLFFSRWLFCLYRYLFVCVCPSASVSSAMASKQHLHGKSGRCGESTCKQTNNKQSSFAKSVTHSQRGMIKHPEHPHTHTYLMRGASQRRVNQEKRRRKDSKGTAKHLFFPRL